MFAFGDKEWPGVSKIVEESGELGQVIGRLMQTHGARNHWASDDLRRDFLDEVADIKAAIRFFEIRGMSDEDHDRFSQRVDAKLMQFLTWHRENTPPEPLCEDEGCDHFGTDHICVPAATRKRRCAAVQYSDMMECKRCELRWDTNDSYPPSCKPFSEIMKAHIDGRKMDTEKS